MLKHFPMCFCLNTAEQIEVEFITDLPIFLSFFLFLPSLCKNDSRYFLHVDKNELCAVMCVNVRLCICIVTSVWEENDLVGDALSLKSDHN